MAAAMETQAAQQEEEEEEQEQEGASTIHSHGDHPPPSLQTLTLTSHLQPTWSTSSW